VQPCLAFCHHWIPSAWNIQEEGGSNCKKLKFAIFMSKIRSLYFKYISENTSATWEAFANECTRRGFDPETIAESFQ
jgi:hypothetical protein